VGFRAHNATAILFDQIGICRLNIGKADHGDGLDTAGAS
jgi:hypothetical protein